LKESAAVPAVQEPSGSALDADGYIVVPTGLPRSILGAVVDDIWRHAGATPRDPATWYQPAIIRPRPGMVEMYHYQSQVTAAGDDRRTARLHPRRHRGRIGRHPRKRVADPVRMGS
jgi:hypothetical protein